MAKFKDVRQAVVPPKLIQRQPGEHYRDRHERRLLANLPGQDAVSEFCAASGLRLAVTSNGHHWSIYPATAQPGDPQFAEWWPSSAKLVFRKQWQKGIHCHEYLQLIVELKTQLAKEKRLNGDPTSPKEPKQ